MEVLPDSVADEERDAVEKILKMLLTSCGELPQSSKDYQEGRCISEWLDQMAQELYAHELCKKRPNSFSFSSETEKLLLVMRECLLSHRWKSALRVLTSITHRLPARYGLTILHCLLELCIELSLVPSGSLMLQLKQYAELTEHHVSIEHFMFCAVSGAPPLVCRAALAPLPHRRRGLFHARDVHHKQLLQRAFNGLASYVEFSSAQLLVRSTGTIDKDLREEAAGKMAPCARDALDKWEGIAGEPGVWDVFVMKQVELLEFMDRPNLAENVLLVYAQKDHGDLQELEKEQEYTVPTTVWPNALRMLYQFYTRHPVQNDERKRVRILQELCTRVPCDELALELYRLSCDGHVTFGKGSNRIVLLFDLLDYASFQFDIRPWKCLAKELQCFEKLSAVAGNVDSLRHCWNIRSDWWPAYHFLPASIPHPTQIEALEFAGIKATVAYFLLGPDSEYIQSLLAVTKDSCVKIKSISRLKKVMQTMYSFQQEIHN